MEVKIKKVYDDSCIPMSGTTGSAGYDIHAYTHGTDIVIQPHTTMKISSGVKIAIPDMYFGAIFARSGLATKQGLRPANCVGVIDSDYRGEMIVALHNDTDEAKIVHHGDRIAQLIIIPYLMTEFKVVEDLSDTDRGDGGFGSTGVN